MAYARWEYPETPDDVDGVVNYFDLGKVVRVWPTLEAVLVSAEGWATELADEHIADTHPSFMEAQIRMSHAHSTHFELEHRLRVFVQTTLEEEKTDGVRATAP